MSDGIKFLTDVVPELANVPLERVKQLWREWANSQPPDVRLWLKDPLSPAQRRTLQFGFAATYYQDHMLIAFQNTQEERWQKLLAQDPRTQERLPILEQAQRDVPLLHPTPETVEQFKLLLEAQHASELVSRQLPDGSVIYAQTEDEADALVAREVEKAAEDAVGIPE